MTQLAVPVHVGSETPEQWDETEALQRQYGDDASPYLRDKRRPAVSSPDLDWSGLGFEPRWVSFDSADCVVALQPSIFSGQGADEFERFRHGAAKRGETALVISPIGSIGPQRLGVYNVFGPPVDSVSIGQTHTSINGRLLGKEAKVRLVAGLGGADGDLARRLLSLNPAPTWRSLTIEGSTLMQPGGPTREYPPEGELVPILETELGEPVVGAWISPDGVERRYVVPVETPWTVLLPWLLEQALPELVPGALRRARRPLAFDQDLMTRRERDARAALADLEADYIARRGDLERQLEDAQTATVATREGLLYGTGQQLVDAVRSVFEFAGIEVIDLDVRLGGTKNADLLCTYGGQSKLVEVKSASGSASERAYQDLLRHLREWPALPRSTPIQGGALVIGHEIRTVPLERSPRPYAREEFLAAQTEPVIAALELFASWRDEDVPAIRALLFGTGVDSEMESGGQESEADAAFVPADTRPMRRRWFRRN
ncbi:hypothetical protein ET445_13800 [Agromyces protaetiae]|uniref:Uncharacterized protein n=1 Tax=Agromyces protaetiae TaxID=2509455 RepID=A0A4P6FUI8_9MICO|nr:hypothetical protein [Agromyces protaetiae]QAY74238.1 hypothetical protein ET445_13800 [Agromyces protaetiae]